MEISLKNSIFFVFFLVSIGFSSSENAEEKSNDSAVSDDGSRKEKFLVGVARTHVVTVISPTTVSYLLTCVAAFGAPACRRRKKRAEDDLSLPSPLLDDQLSSSLDEILQENDNDDDTESRRQKMILWNTKTSTVFTTSLVASATVTASFFCSFPGLTLIPSC